MESAKGALETALNLSKQLSPLDQLRLISLLSEQLRGEIETGEEPTDMLTLAGLGAEVWREIDVTAYLEQERASRES